VPLCVITFLTDDASVLSLNTFSLVSFDVFTLSSGLQSPAHLPPPSLPPLNQRCVFLSVELTNAMIHIGEIPEKNLVIDVEGGITKHREANIHRSSIA
jgi:hypothetical protein